METEDSASASTSADLLSVFKNKRRSSAVSFAAQKGNHFSSLRVCSMKCYDCSDRLNNVEL